MNTDYEQFENEIDIEETPEWEIENQKWVDAQAALGSELLALGLPDVAVNSSMNGEGFDCFLDVSGEEREEVYTKFAKVLDIEIDEDDGFYSEVDKWLGNRMDQLFDWN